MVLIRLSAVSPVVTIAVPAENVLFGQSATLVISINALPEVTDVHIFLPSASAQESSFSAINVTSGNVSLEFSSVNRYNNGTYTVNFTNAVGSDTVDFQLTVFC